MKAEIPPSPGALYEETDGVPVRLPAPEAPDGGEESGAEPDALAV